MASMTPWWRGNESTVIALWMSDTLKKHWAVESERVRKELAPLQPWKAPEALPPIEQEDVVLVVWMAVEREDGAG